MTAGLKRSMWPTVSGTPRRRRQIAQPLALVERRRQRLLDEQRHAALDHVARRRRRAARVGTQTVTQVERSSSSMRAIVGEAARAVARATASTRAASVSATAASSTPAISRVDARVVRAHGAEADDGGAKWTLRSCAES